MKRRTIFLMIGIVFAGFLSYLGGYTLVKDDVQMKMVEPVSVQRSLLRNGSDADYFQKEYYVVWLEKQMLHIYKMPENVIYDSVKLSTLQISEEEKIMLREGVTFETLTDVFGFLENSMS